MFTRRLFILAACRSAAAAAVFFRAGNAAGKGWEIKFKKVRDLLRLKAGGVNGPLIKFKDRGDETHTWTDKDPVESKELGTWFDAKSLSIQLHAETNKREAGVGERQCELVVSYGGKEIGTWQMSAKEEIKKFERHANGPA